LQIYKKVITFARNFNKKMVEDKKIVIDSPKAWLLAARPKTLTGAAVPVMIGTALAYVDSALYGEHAFSWLAALLCLLFSFAMQIDANFINDFYDYINGTDDAETRLGPRRACAQGWVKLESMKKAIALTTCAACIIGLPLVYFGGWEMVLVGMLCVVFAFLYTVWFSYQGLGDLLVLVFFGVVPVCCTYYVQLHTFTWELVIASLACGLVIDALLIVNNFRDRDNDRVAGKQTIIVKLGAKAGLLLYIGVGISAILLGVTFVVNGHLLAFVLPFIYLVLHYFTYLNIKRIYQGKALNLCLGETARNIFIYGICVSVGILLS